MNTIARHPNPHRIAPLLLALLLVAAGSPVAAGELRATLANDLAPGNPRPDDLYTSDLELQFSGETFGLLAGERMFTDRPRGLRFDETHLAVTRRLPSLGGWDARGSVGLLQAGRGLLGESAQNRLHSVIGSPLVELRYVEARRTFVTGAVAFDRRVGAFGRADVDASVEGSTAPGFRSWLRAGAVVSRPLGGGASVAFGVGLRADRAESQWLPPAIRGVSPTGHVALEWRGLELRYSWNDYGTRTPHLSLALRIPIASPPPAP